MAILTWPVAMSRDVLPPFRGVKTLNFSTLTNFLYFHTSNTSGYSMIFRHSRIPLCYALCIFAQDVASTASQDRAQPSGPAVGEADGDGARAFCRSRWPPLNVTSEVAIVFVKRLLVSKRRWRNADNFNREIRENGFFLH